MLWGRIHRPQHPRVRHLAAWKPGARRVVSKSAAQTAMSTIERKEKHCGSALQRSRPSRSGMNNVTTATSFLSWCRHSCQHGQKCEAQEVSWSRTNTQLEAWLRPRPRITGSSAENLALIDETSACGVEYITESAEGGAWYRSRERFFFFLANSHNRRDL
jgi:hypothetical protein